VLYEQTDLLARLGELLSPRVKLLSLCGLLHSTKRWTARNRDDGSAESSAFCQSAVVQNNDSTTTMQRDAFQRLQSTIFPGEIKMVVVWKLGRLGWSLHDPIPLLIELQDLGVAFQLLTEVIDTATPMCCAVLQMIGVLVELERSLIQERTKAGGVAAKTGVVKIGREPSLFAQTSRLWAQADRAGRDT
jgi:DNA invertase Pin-like site-specific DNA recombinase